MYNIERLTNNLESFLFLFLYVNHKNIKLEEKKRVRKHEAKNKIKYIKREKEKKLIQKI